MAGDFMTLTFLLGEIEMSLKGGPGNPSLEVWWAERNRRKGSQVNSHRGAEEKETLTGVLLKKQKWSPQREQVLDICL